MNKYSKLIIAVLFSLFFLTRPLITRAEVVNKVIAVVNNKIITYSDLMRMLYPLYSQYKNVYTEEELKKKLNEARDDVLNQLIENELILQEAKRKTDLDIAEKQIQEYVAHVISKFPSKEVFMQSLEQEHMTLKEFEESIKDQLLVKKLSEKEVAARILITPQDIMQKYEQEKEKYQTPEEFHVFLILIKKTGNADKDSENKKLADEIRSSIKNEDDFQANVKKYSEGPGKESGGDLGFLKKGTLLKELDTAMESLKAGDVSPVIETDIGYHLLFLKAKKKSEYVPVEQLWDRIKSDLFLEKADQIRKNWVQELKNNAYIKIVND